MTPAETQASYLFLAVIVLFGLVVLPILIRRRAGRTLFPLGRPLLQRSWGLAWAAFYAAGSVYLATHLILWLLHITHDAHESPPFYAMELVLVAGGPAVWMMVFLQGYWRINQHGLVSFLHIVFWDQVASYTWADAENAGGRGVLTISFTRPQALWAGRQLSWRFPQRRKRAILQILREYIGPVRVVR